MPGYFKQAYPQGNYFTQSAGGKNTDLYSEFLKIIPKDDPSTITILSETYSDKIYYCDKKVELKESRVNFDLKISELDQIFYSAPELNDELKERCFMKFKDDPKAVEYFIKKTGLLNAGSFIEFEILEFKATRKAFLFNQNVMHLFYGTAAASTVKKPVKSFQYEIEPLRQLVTLEYFFELKISKHFDRETTAHIINTVCFLGKGFDFDGGGTKESSEEIVTHLKSESKTGRESSGRSLAPKIIADKLIVIGDKYKNLGNYSSSQFLEWTKWSGSNLSSYTKVLSPLLALRGFGVIVFALGSTAAPIAPLVVVSLAVGAAGVNLYTGYKTNKAAKKAIENLIVALDAYSMAAKMNQDIGQIVLMNRNEPVLEQVLCYKLKGSGSNP